MQGGLARLLLGFLVLGSGCVPIAGAPTPALDNRESLLHACDSMLAAPEVRQATWGTPIVDPYRADTLYAHDAGKLMVRAAIHYIVTSALALDLLGPDSHSRMTILTNVELR